MIRNGIGWTYWIWWYPETLYEHKQHASSPPLRLLVNASERVASMNLGQGETDAVAEIIKEQIWPNPIKWLQGDSTVQLVPPILKHIYIFKFRVSHKR